MVGGSEWARLDTVVDKALELPPEARDPFLSNVFADDPETLATARRVIEAVDRSNGFLEGTAPTVDDVTPPSECARFGAWRIVGELGRGGMGVVHAVVRVDGGFEQSGALKQMRSGDYVDTARFAAERQLLAELDHPGIARLLDGGIDQDGYPWMVMERIDGVPIDCWCTERAVPLEGRIRLALDVIDAVAAAHRMLVLHRDLKPANVLVDADGRVRVIDFGIAKRLDLSAQTEAIAPLSAPYAAPELLTGAPPGPPVDVYGVAALLYELACGQPPIDLAGVPVALGVGRVLEVEPVRLTARRGQCPVLVQAPSALVADLDAIIARALRKEPAARYPTLEALADDLRRALDGRVVAARSGDGAYRLRRAIWRARWPIAASLAIVAVLAGGLVATEVQRREAVAARDAALAEEARSEAVRQSLYLVLAESVETAGIDATSRDVLQRATDRIAAEFARDPAESARVLHALGELHFYLGDYAAAKAALGPLVGGGRNIPRDTLAAARYDLAQAMIRLGEVDGARPLLGQAQAYWGRDPAKWRARLIDSRLVEAQILRTSDPAAAVALLKAAMMEHDAMHGPRNRQAGVFQNNLGVALQTAGDLEGAGAAFRAADAIWRATGLTETPDALNTANNLAAIEMLSGRPQAAEPLFAQAVRVRRKLFGASGGTAAVLNNHGKVLLILGQVDAALAALTEAAAMAERFAGAGSMHQVAALSGLADAQLAKGLTSEALATARRAVAASGLGKAPPPARAMSLIAQAKAQRANGDRAGARASLDQVDAIVPALGPAGARLATAAADVRKAL